MSMPYLTGFPCCESLPRHHAVACRGTVSHRLLIQDGDRIVRRGMTIQAVRCTMFHVKYLNYLLLVPVVTAILCGVIIALL